MKPFRLTKNHNETGVFTKDDGIIGNDQNNQNIPDNNNQINFEPNRNHIHINLINNQRRLGEFGGENNLEMENNITD